MNSGGDNNSLLLFVMIEIWTHEWTHLHPLPSEYTSSVGTSAACNIRQFILRDIWILLILELLPLRNNGIFLASLINIKLLLKHSSGSIRFLEELLLILRWEVGLDILSDSNYIAGVASKCWTQIVHSHDCLGISWLPWLSLTRFIKQAVKSVLQVMLRIGIEVAEEHDIIVILECILEWKRVMNANLFFRDFLIIITVINHIQLYLIH